MDVLTYLVMLSPVLLAGAAVIEMLLKNIEL